MKDAITGIAWTPNSNRRTKGNKSTSSLHECRNFAGFLRIRDDQWTSMKRTDIQWWWHYNNLYCSSLKQHLLVISTFIYSTIFEPTELLQNDNLVSISIYLYINIYNRNLILYSEKWKQSKIKRNHAENTSGTQRTERTSITIITRHWHI